MTTFIFVASTAAPAPVAFVAPTSLPAPAPTPALLARDVAGTVWAHANPVELYRWLARRNDLLSTIAVAARRGEASWKGLWSN